MSLLSSSKILLISLIIATSFFLSSTTIAQDHLPIKNFKFFFSAVAKVFKDGQPQIISLTNNMVLKSGNLIKFYFEFEREAYLYLFHMDTRGDLVLLFPNELEESKIQRTTPVFIPEGVRWIEIDADAGKETFHIIVSSLQLKKLEFLYSNHLNLKDRAEIQQSAQSILTEIKSISRESLKKQAEKPLRIAGKLRGNSGNSQTIPQELFRSASEITTGKSYVKTITIDHH